jgi:ankyrin repeat protein
LKWTFLAKRPLTVSELRHAISISIDPSTILPGKLPLAYDRTLDWENFPSGKSLIDWCLCLVIIDEETHTVRLVHKSLHDYLTLLHDNGGIFPNGHSEIAYTCLQYMCFNDDEHEINPLEKHVTEDIKDLRRARFCLLDYATKNFGYHLHDQSSCTTDMINGLFPDTMNLNCLSTGLRSEFLDPFGRSDGNYSDHEYISTMQIHLRIQFAISCGLENVFINHIDASNQSIDVNNKLRGSTMLLQASRIGHEGIVRILLERNVDVNLGDRDGWPALSWASEKGHDAVVKLLLQAEGIDINSKDDEGRTALSYALPRNKTSTAQLLLTAGAIDGRETSIPANSVQPGTPTADQTAE